MLSENNVLSDGEITQILKKQKIKINGIYMKNELPSKLKKGYYIINLQSSTEGFGTHWCSFYYDKKQSFYFDSYGFIAPLEVHNKIIPYYYNDKDIQDLYSTACGFYSLAFVIFMDRYANKEQDKKEVYASFVNLFTDDTKKNEKTLYHILYN